MEDPGIGYRYLSSGETLREGDEWADFLFERWEPTQCAGERVGPDVYRRRVTDEDDETEFHS